MGVKNCLLFCSAFSALFLVVFSDQYGGSLDGLTEESLPDDFFVPDDEDYFVTEPTKPPNITTSTLVSTTLSTEEYSSDEDIILDSIRATKYNSSAIRVMNSSLYDDYMCTTLSGRSIIANKCTVIITAILYACNSYIIQIV